MAQTGPRNSAAFDSPDPDQVYQNYLDSCRRQGIEPVPPDRARELITEWAQALTGARGDSPPSH